MVMPAAAAGSAMLPLSTPTPGESVALNSALEPVSVQPGG
jgi:hypothetical protein